MSQPDEPSTPPATGPEKASEDPRELARRLAEEAKAKQLARQLVEQAKAKAAAAARPPVVEQAKRSLADRTSKPVSVEDALRRAIEEEKSAPPPAARPAAQAAAKPVAPTSSPAPSVAPPSAAPPSAAPVAAPARVVLHDAATVIQERLPGAEIVRLVTVDTRVVFEALWRAHRARAQAERDLRTLVTADVLLNASSRLAPSALVAAHIQAGDEAWAVWIDASAPALLAIAPQPELLLAGL